MDGFDTVTATDIPGNTFNHMFSSQRHKLNSPLVNKAHPLNIHSVISAAYQFVLELPDAAEESCHFFLSGGDSLLATRLISELHEKFRGCQLQLSLSDLLLHPEVCELSDFLRKQSKETTSSHAK